MVLHEFLSAVLGSLTALLLVVRNVRALHHAMAGGLSVERYFGGGTHVSCISVYSHHSDSHLPGYLLECPLYLLVSPARYSRESIPNGTCSPATLSWSLLPSSSHSQTRRISIGLTFSLRSSSAPAAQCLFSLAPSTSSHIEDRSQC